MAERVIRRRGRAFSEIPRFVSGAAETLVGRGARTFGCGERKSSTGTEGERGDVGEDAVREAAWRCTDSEVAGASGGLGNASDASACGTMLVEKGVATSAPGAQA